MYITTVYYPNYISHHGIKGQKWGIRRYQNEDGSYTEKGLKRRAKLYNKIDKAYEKETKAQKLILQNKNASKYSKERAKQYIDKRTAYRDLRKSEVDATMDYAENRMLKSAIIGGAIGGPWGAALGTVISTIKNNEAWDARNSLETIYGDFKVKDINY